MNDNHDSEHMETESTTPAVYIAAVWALALIPLAWGFINTLMRAVKLFQ